MGKRSSVSEDEIIQLLRSRVYHLSEFSMDFSDDCAILPPSASRLLLSTDAMIEDTHFRRRWMPPEDLGYKSLAVNLSDLAAKAAKPHGFMLSWGLPPDIEASWIESFARGLGACSRRFSCPLLGGNTSRSEHGVFVSITVFGEAPIGPLKQRTMAQAGDWICVTGHLGEAAAGLLLLEGTTEGETGTRSSDPQVSDLIRAQLHPEPRIAEAKWLSRHSAVHAMMDLSDGLRSDLPRMLRASKAGFQVDLHLLPQSEGLKYFAKALELPPRLFAADGGEDYELLLTIAPNEAPRILRQFAQEFEIPLTRVGQVNVAGAGEWINDVSGIERAGFVGFEHF